jgi:hypothetical protein
VHVSFLASILTAPFLFPPLLVHNSQQDFGFCWGVERSIALAYEAVNHFPDRKVHITNELIHNPEVNDNLNAMNVQFIKKIGDGKKDYESVQDGDVVILPAFGASLEEMDYFDKKVCRTVLCCDLWRTLQADQQYAAFLFNRDHQSNLFVTCLLSFIECRSRRHDLPVGFQGLERYRQAPKEGTHVDHSRQVRSRGNGCDRQFL